MVVTIDKARRQVWNQARTEIKILRRRWGEDSPSFDSLADKIFGKKSRLFHLMVEELNLSYPEYCRFLATLFSGCSFSQSTSRLLYHRRFIKKGLTEPTNMLKIFRRIDSLSIGGETIWMKVESAFNSEIKDSFLSARRQEEKLTTALDDDKQPFNYSKNTLTYGLQRCRHIQKNRFGFTAHTCGLSATGIILCVMFQREGESQTQIYERMIKFMFGDQTGNGDPNLHGTCTTTTVACVRIIINSFHSYNNILLFILIYYHYYFDFVCT